MTGIEKVAIRTNKTRDEINYEKVGEILLDFAKKEPKYFTVTTLLNDIRFDDDVIIEFYTVSKERLEELLKMENRYFMKEKDLVAEQNYTRSLKRRIEELKETK